MGGQLLGVTSDEGSRCTLLPGYQTPLCPGGPGRCQSATLPRFRLQLQPSEVLQGRRPPSVLTCRAIGSLWASPGPAW